MNIIVLLTMLTFLIACVWAAIQKAWPTAFIAGGLFLLALDASNLIAS